MSNFRFGNIGQVFPSPSQGSSPRCLFRTDAAIQIDF